MTIKVAIEAGHGGSNSTPGKRDPDGVHEWNYNDTMVRAFIEELRKYNGVEVRRFDDATGKTDVPLATRTANANKWGADYYISFHNNALAGKWGTHGGTETFYYVDAKQPGNKVFAGVIHDALVGALGLRNRGLKNGNHLWVVRQTNMPAVLIEGGFMDSTTDIKVLRNKDLLTKSGRAMASAFAKWKKLSLRKPVTTTPTTTPTPPPTPPSDTLYRVRKTWADAKTQIGAFTNLASAKDLVDKNKDFEVYDPSGKVVYAGKQAPPPKPIPSYIGKRVEARVDNLRYYNRPSWSSAHVAGTLRKGIGFPKVVDRVTVDGAMQYKVQNSNGQVFYLTASAQYVTLT